MKYIPSVINSNVEKKGLPSPFTLDLSFDP